MYHIKKKVDQRNQNEHTFYVVSKTNKILSKSFLLLWHVKKKVKELRGVSSWCKICNI